MLSPFWIARAVDAHLHCTQAGRELSYNCLGVHPLRAVFEWKTAVIAALDWNLEICFPANDCRDLI